MKKITLISLVIFNVCLFQAQSFFGQNVDSKKYVMMISSENTNEEIKNKIDFFKEKLDVDVKIENIKRDKDNKITALNFSYKDNKGNQGQSNLTGKEPIKGIQFAYEIDEDGYVNSSLTTNKTTPLINRKNQSTFGKSLNNDDDFIKFFDKDTLNSPFKNGFSKSTQIIIDKDGKVKKSVIENGKKIEETEEDFTEDDDMMFNFNFSGSNDLKEFMEKLKGNSFNFNFDDLSGNMPNMSNMKEQLKKMQEEMENMKKELKEMKSKKK